MKKTTTIIVLAISILLVGLYTVTSTYSVIIEVIEKYVDEKEQEMANI